MTAPQVGTKGAKLNLLVRQGATTGPFTMLVRDSEGGPPINLTGCEIRSEIRKTPDDGVVAATAVVDVIDTVQGAVKWYFSPDDTREMEASPIDETEPESRYVWDMELEFPDGRIIPLLYGNVGVFREVTKEEITL